ncbi:MAG: hypothetical protein LC799_18765, partial [Actinobacteria bacterium]|nr:hypothetical protein [Actinomycetota bacterium]
LRLTDLDGHTQADAAAIIGLSTTAMKTRVQRARAQLRALFTRCCEIELDRRGGIIDYQPNNNPCNCPTSTSTRQPAPSPQTLPRTDPTAPAAACNCA